MAQLRCRECGGTVSPNEVICHTCGEILLAAGATTTVAAPAGSPPGGPTPVTAVSPTPTLAAGAGSETAEAGHCPHCRAIVPDPHSLVCLACFKELEDRPGTRTPALATRRELPVPERLMLLFPTGEVEVGRGRSLPLGRDAATSPAAGRLAAFDNVSRRHATIGLETDGRAWIRDEDSTNGTYVDGRRVLPGETADLADGATVRLAADVAAQVRLMETRGLR